MPRPHGVEFGTRPGQWIMAGLVCGLGGGVFVLLGGALLIAACDGSFTDHDVTGIVFLLIGLVAALTGASVVVKRRDFTIVLSDHAVHVGPYYERETIPFREISGVVRGVDDDVCLERTDRVFLYRLPNYFASDAEANRFTEELKKRVENAKRSPGNPPATS